MSYTRLGTVTIVDIASLRKAVDKNPDLEFVEDAKTYLHEGYERKCVHKIKVKGNEHYEIGVIEHPDGTGYQLVWDSSAHFEDIIGYGASVINTDYTREVSRDYAARNGYVMTEATDAEGKIVLTLEN